MLWKRKHTTFTKGRSRTWIGTWESRGGRLHDESLGCVWGYIMYDVTRRIEEQLAKQMTLCLMNFSAFQVRVLDEREVEVVRSLRLPEVVHRRLSSRVCRCFEVGNIW